ncbi:MAG: YggT family protein [Chloroflexota bacterium]
MNASLLYEFLAFFFQLLGWTIVARALLTWFIQDPNNPAMQILSQITDPILVPLSRIIPRFGMFDFTPMIAVLILFGIHLFFASLAGG